MKKLFVYIYLPIIVIIIHSCSDDAGTNFEEPLAITATFSSIQANVF